MKTKMMSVLGLIIIFITAASFSFSPTQKPWSVPDKYAKMTNPLKGDASSVSSGKSVWAKQCQSCHGKTGKGDGTKAAGLKTHPGDFTAAAFKGQTDGALYYKISDGRDEMPAFGKKLPDAEDIWSVINYMRTFK